MELKHEYLVLDGGVKDLLIVPYGIETLFLPSRLVLLFPFNRTLWN